ncbi:MAG: chemotaxis-specific protein-glutamate methyltransferase CheB [Aureispira sp.]
MSVIKPIRVLIADDSAIMRVLIQQIIGDDPAIVVIGEANDGQSAFKKTKELRPDVVLMDLTMGDFDGKYGVAKIMQYCPTPILILSAMGNVDMQPILETLALGAIDYINKPVKNRVNMQEVKQVLLDKIKLASQVKLSTVLSTKVTANSFSHSFDEQGLAYDCIVMGASTGGPRSLEYILQHLPENLAVPVFIIQHIPSSFAASLAIRLNSLTPLKVELAAIDKSPEAGVVYLASGEGNLILRRIGKKIYFSKTEEKGEFHNNPSVDVMMHSVANVYKNRAIGCLLTGMGKDGSVGLKAIRSEGGYTLAESKASCVVFGMPSAAQQNDAVVQMVHLNDIPGFLVSCLS